MRKIFIILLFLPVISFSQNIGCTDTLALNFDPIADVDDSSCIYCDSLANFSTDTIVTYDSLVQLNVLNITDATYTWNSSNIYNGQDIQTLLNYGYTPFEINNLLNQNPTFGGGPSGTKLRSKSTSKLLKSSTSLSHGNRRCFMF